MNESVSMRDQLEELREALKDKVPEQDTKKPFKVKSGRNIGLGLVVVVILGYAAFRGFKKWK